jgi:hypothetical protein
MQRVISAVLGVCHKCVVREDCALDDCTPVERRQALAAAQRVRDEQRHLLGQIQAERPTASD